MKEALQMLSEQTENKWLKRAISEVLLSVEKGNTLADSMRGQSDIFPPMLINMVEAGENSGSLEMAFTRMAVQFEKEAKLKATIRKATIYPIILVVAAIGVVAVMLLFVIPIFIDMFADLDVEMPGITMWVMNTSEWMTAHWYMILGLIIQDRTGQTCHRQGQDEDAVVWKADSKDCLRTVCKDNEYTVVVGYLYY